MNEFDEWWYNYIKDNMSHFLPAKTADDHFDMLRHAAQDAWTAATAQQFVPSVPNEVEDIDSREDEYEIVLDGC